MQNLKEPEKTTKMSENKGCESLNNMESSKTQKAHYFFRFEWFGSVLAFQNFYILKKFYYI